MNECQFHHNCGGYCETPEQITSKLCADCQELKRLDEVVRLRIQEITEAATELLNELDASAWEQEPHSGQRACMERLRDALAA